MLKRLLAAALILITTLQTRAADIDFDATGQARAIVEWPGALPFSSSVWIVRDGWQTILQQSNLQNVKRENKTITGTFETADGSIAFEQSTRDLPKATRIDYELSSKSNIELDGIYWFGSIDINQFAGGTVTIAGDRQTLPEKQAQKDLVSGSSDRIEITDKTGAISITIKFDRQLKISVQDARSFGINKFQIYVPMLETEIKPGTRAKLGVSISANSPQDDSPARIEIDPSKIISTFDGFGGNFVYDIESPVTDFNLRTLKLTWARLGMDLTTWEPTNDNQLPAEPIENWGKLIDTATSPIRRRFHLDKRVFDLSKERTIVSVWRLPEWLYDQPLPLARGSQRDTAGTVKQAMWPELIECVTTYLIHLKNNYGVEPSLFSFNEPDYGIYLTLNAEEMSLLYQQMGKAFENAGLKTKLMLPDSASLRDGLELMKPSLNSPATMKYIGAIAYHVWSGEQDLWDSWAKIAETHKLPLLVTEAGLDANAWEDFSYNTPISALRLAERYIQLLRSSRAQAIIEWEWTGDYSFYNHDGGGYRPTSRYWMMWQLTKNTPTNGRIVATTSNKLSVNAALVISGEKDAPAFSLHISNAGQSRKIAVNGLPTIAKKITIVTTDFFTDKPPTVKEINFPIHELELNVPGGSLVTVTTMDVEQPKR